MEEGEMLQNSNQTFTTIWLNQVLNSKVVVWGPTEQLRAGMGASAFGCLGTGRKQNGVREVEKRGLGKF